MSESTVSTTVAFLFGGMVFLLFYTRLGGMATTLLAGAILVGYMLIEVIHAVQERRANRHAADVAMRRLREWAATDRRW